MEYKKPHLSYSEQAQRMLDRGLVGDHTDIGQKLASVSYYRLSAYWYPFRQMDPVTKKRKDEVIPGTTFESVWNHYRFDRKLRTLFIDAIERIEIALRTRLVHLYTKSHSPFDYVYVQAPVKTPGASTQRLNPLTAKLQTLEKQAGIEKGSCNIKKCSYECVKHFFQHYGDNHQHLPFWMFAEITDFGYMGLFYKSLYKSPSNSICSQLAAIWDITPETLESWLTCLNTLRNTCAHHGRVWNNGWGLKPKLPKWNEKGRRDWYKVYSVERNKWENPTRNSPKLGFDQSKTGVLLFICRYLIKKIAPQSQWHVRVAELFQEFESCGINFRSMGLPEHWQEHPIWQSEEMVKVDFHFDPEMYFQIEQAAERKGLTPAEWITKSLTEQDNQN